jgi:hypothetical protein
MQATTMRLDPKLIESLKVEAKKDSRSLNNLINKVLQMHIDKINIEKDQKLCFEEAMKRVF